MKRCSIGWGLILLALIVSCEDDGPSRAASDGFTARANWTAFDAGTTDGLDSRAFFGTVSDGRYLYYVPVRGAQAQATVLRYDSRAAFEAVDGWTSYAVGVTDGLMTGGYAGAAFDGRYIYFVPFVANQQRHARVLRLDTQARFDAASSWRAYDAAPHTGGAVGYNGALFDGRYVYFTPYGYPPAAHGVVLRLDTRGDFGAASSWTGYDAGATGGLNTRGYYGQAFDGRYLYLAPFNDGTTYHGRVLRHDTQGAFSDPASWHAYDAGRSSDLPTVGYKGAVYDGRYLYFVPFRDEGDAHGRVLRLDTLGAFSAASSWLVHDAGLTAGLDTRGYVGAAFDGRHIYFCPYKLGDGPYHGTFLRYDAQADFRTASSWSAFAPGALNALPVRGYKGVVYDGTHLYFAPYHDGTAFSGIALRYRP